MIGKEKRQRAYVGGGGWDSREKDEMRSAMWYS